MNVRFSVGVIAPEYTVGFSYDDKETLRELGGVIAGNEAVLVVRSLKGMNKYLVEGFDSVGGVSVCFSHFESKGEFVMSGQNPNDVDFVVYCGDADYMADFSFIRSCDVVVFYPGHHNEVFYLKAGIDFSKKIGVLASSLAMGDFKDVLDQINYPVSVFEDADDLIANLFI